MTSRFVCVHLGARSHYLVPKAMELKGNLAALITDTWVTPSFLRALLLKLPLRVLRSLSSRHTDSIFNRHVTSFSCKFLLVELFLRLAYRQEWKRIIFRNRWFQQLAARKFRKFPVTHTVFGLSYTSLEVFKAAKNNGQRTVLFQVDPGFMEEEIMAQEVRSNSIDFPTSWERAPASFWLDWQRECELADCIMVNSEWSAKNLVAHGVSPHKIKVIALPFGIENKHLSYKKCFPSIFTKSRPLRCLFLGTLTLRKGIHLVLRAAEMLVGYPVEFILVGRSELNQAAFKPRNVTYRGLATRAETDLYYKQADLFLFPTISDGFGLTQLEAMAWQLPVIASTCCGKVVKDQVNGLEMPFFSAEALAESILYLLHNPAQLQALSSNCLPTVKAFNMEKFSEELAALLEA